MLRKILILFIPLFIIGCQSQPTVQEPTAFELYQNGLAAYDQADYQTAIHDFESAVSLNPNYAEAFFWMGSAYSKLNATDQAISAYRDCLRIQPGYAAANLELGIIYFDKFEYIAAESYLNKATQYDPGNPLGYFYLAEIYNKKGKCERPKSLYKKALDIKPDFHDAREGLKEVTQKNCKKSPPKPKKPVYEKRDDFGGGGKALKPGEW